MPRGGGSSGSSGGGGRSSGGGGGSRGSSSSSGGGGTKGSSGSSGSKSSSSSSSSSKSSSSSSGPSVRITSTGKVDGRSTAVRSGDLKLTSDGSIDLRSKAVKNGSVLVTQGGGLDKRSAAYAGPSASPSSSSSSSSSSHSHVTEPIFFAKDGSIDGRSSLVKNGDIILKQDGQIDGRSAAVRDGRIRLTNDGSIDLRSAASPSKESVTQAKVDQCYTEMVAERGDPSSEAQKKLYRDYAEYKITGRMKTGLLRHHNQAAKREESRSAYLSEKDAAHKLSLEVIVEMISRKHGPRLSYETVQKMREAVNPVEGFRMVFAETNRSLHRQLDSALLEKGFEETDQPLTKQEEARAIQACKTYLLYQGDLSPGITKVATEFFMTLKNQDGHSIWESSSQSE